MATQINAVQAARSVAQHVAKLTRTVAQQEKQIARLLAKVGGGAGAAKVARGPKAAPAAKKAAKVVQGFR